MITEIPLEEYLGQDNPWTARLLGTEAFQQTRNAAQVEREYNRDLYGSKLRDYQESPQTFWKKTLFGSMQDSVVSLGEQVFRMPNAAFTGLQRSAFLELLERFDVKGPLCELGAGHGQNHLWLRASQSRDVYGGEYSANGVELAERLGFEVAPFNFYNIEDYALIRPGSAVFSFHAVEQIPDARCILEGLRSQREKIERVIHLEPLYRADRDSRLGRLRNRYAEINDYNLNLLDCLESAPDIEIDWIEKDAVGHNPLNPGSFVVWHFV